MIADLPLNERYIVTIGGKRIYTRVIMEDTELRAFQNIDVAVLCMNLPHHVRAESISAVRIQNRKLSTFYHYCGHSAPPTLNQFKTQAGRPGTSKSACEMGTEPKVTDRPGGDSIKDASWASLRRA